MDKICMFFFTPSNMLTFKTLNCNTEIKKKECRFKHTTMQRLYLRDSLGNFVTLYLRLVNTHHNFNDYTHINKTHIFACKKSDFNFSVSN